MSPHAPHRRRRGAQLASVLALLLALATGCGSETAPVEAVPQLDQMLTAVDDAVAEQRYGAARNRIHALVKEVKEARQDGDLDAAQADRVLAAAAELLSALPGTPARKPSPSPSGPSSSTPPASSAPPTSAPAETATGGGGQDGGTADGSGGSGGSGDSGGSDKEQNSGPPADKGKGKSGGGKGGGKGPSKRKG